MRLLAAAAVAKDNVDAGDDGRRLTALNPIETCSARRCRKGDAWVVGRVAFGLGHVTYDTFGGEQHMASFGQHCGGREHTSM